jgi:hypothetical protein
MEPAPLRPGGPRPVRQGGTYAPTLGRRESCPSRGRVRWDLRPSRWAGRDGCLGLFERLRASLVKAYGRVLVVPLIAGAVLMTYRGFHPGTLILVTDTPTHDPLLKANGLMHNYNGTEAKGTKAKRTFLLKGYSSTEIC